MGFLLQDHFKITDKEFCCSETISMPFSKEISSKGPLTTVALSPLLAFFRSKASAKVWNRRLQSRLWQLQKLLPNPQLDLSLQLDQELSRSPLEFCIPITSAWQATWRPLCFAEWPGIGSLRCARYHG